MRLVKRGIVAAMGLLVCSICFGGCADGAKTDAKNNAKEKVVLSLWGAEEDAQLLQTMVNDFKEEYKDEADIDITISPESELTCKTTVLADPEGAADVFTFAEDQLDALVDAEALLPITEQKEQTIEACGGKDSVAILAASRGDALYAYPLTSSNGYFMFYNSQYFSEEDVTSFDKMLEIASSNGKKVSMDFTSGWYTYAFFMGAGLDVYKDDKTNQNICEWNATDRKYNGVDVLNAMLSIAQNEGFASLTDEEFVNGIKDGTVIAGVSGTWNAKLVQEKFGEHYAAAKLPQFTINGDLVQMHSVVGYKEVGVNAHSENPEWAQRLAAWITSEENQKLRFQERGETPANLVAAQSDEVQAAPAVAALSKQAEYGHIQKVTESFWTPACRMGTIIVAGNSKKKDLQQLLDETVEKIEEIPESEEE